MRFQIGGFVSRLAIRALFSFAVGPGDFSPGVRASTVFRQAFFVPFATLRAPSATGLKGEGLAGFGVG